MIKANKGMVSVEGFTTEILADLACISGAIAESGLRGIPKEKLKEEVLRAVERGFEEDHETVDLREVAPELMKTAEEFAEKLATILMKGKGEE